MVKWAGRVRRGGEVVKWAGRVRREDGGGEVGG